MKQKPQDRRPKASSSGNISREERDALRRLSITAPIRDAVTKAQKGVRKSARQLGIPAEEFSDSWMKKKGRKSAKPPKKSSNKSSNKVTQKGARKPVSRREKSPETSSESSASDDEDDDDDDESDNDEEDEDEWITVRERKPASRRERSPQLSSDDEWTPPQRASKPVNRPTKSVPTSRKPTGYFLKWSHELENHPFITSRYSSQLPAPESRRRSAARSPPPGFGHGFGQHIPSSPQASPYFQGRGRFGNAPNVSSSVNHTQASPKGVARSGRSMDEPIIIRDEFTDNDYEENHVGGVDNNPFGYPPTHHYSTGAFVPTPVSQQNEMPPSQPYYQPGFATMPVAQPDQIPAGQPYYQPGFVTMPAAQQDQVPVSQPYFPPQTYFSPPERYGPSGALQLPSFQELVRSVNDAQNPPPRTSAPIPRTSNLHWG
ncbi:hypothetical protein F5Y14DRAFT_364258 [Nemania sp. NC0429]|nr:hypothetical protein F5Y14DRAFT_364258 [Nemania sp. NC0429]